MSQNDRRRNPAFRRKKQNRMSMILITIVVIVLTIIVGYRVYNMKIELNENKEKIESLNKELEDEQKRKEEIAEYQKYTQTDEFVEDVAREKLGLVHDDEIVFIKEED